MMANIAKFRPLPSTNFFSNSLFDEFFNRSIGDVVGSDNWISQPAVNILETNDAFLIELAAPGFDKKDFELNVENHRLVVRGKREQAEPENGKQYARREFRFASFERSFKLPETVNQEAVSAVYENGILVVSLPKRDEAKPVVKTISVG